MIQRNTPDSAGQRVILGPGDHGRRMTLEEFFAAGETEGYRYELIEGVVEVSPTADPPHERVVVYLLRLLDRYTDEHAEHLNFVSPRSRLAQRKPAETSPEPDLCGYRGYPLHEVDVDWQNLHPILVVEVLSPGNAVKDLKRNRRIYLGFKGIQEYWIVDPLDDPKHPSMLALRRTGDAWKEVRVPNGGTYQTELFPGLTVDLSRIYPPPPQRNEA